MTAECCESFAGTDMRGETIPDSRSCRAKTSSAKWNLQRVTDRRLAEADRRVLHGVCHWTRLAKYGGLPTIVLQCFDTVGWVIWPVKIVPNMTYNVFGGTLNPTLLLPLNYSGYWMLIITDGKEAVKYEMCLLRDRAACSRLSDSLVASRVRCVARRHIRPVSYTRESLTYVKRWLLCMWWLNYICIDRSSDIAALGTV